MATEASGHTHVHGADCGHVAIRHGGHVDYLHDGELHRIDGERTHICRLSANAQNPDNCTDGHPCVAHDAAHAHGPDCGHERVTHGDHEDYLVAGHLHHVHDGHCDDHGPLELA